MNNESLQEWQERRKRGEVSIDVKTPAEKAALKPKSLRLAINAKCWDCTCQQKIEVTKCVMTDCPLWNIRPWQRDEINQQIISGGIA